MDGIHRRRRLTGPLAATALVLLGALAPQAVAAARDTRGPAIAITAPRAGIVGEPVAITLRAADRSGVARVWVRIDGRTRLATPRRRYSARRRAAGPRRGCLIAPVRRGRTTGRAARRGLRAPRVTVLRVCGRNAPALAAGRHVITVIARDTGGRTRAARRTFTVTGGTGAPPARTPTPTTPAVPPDPGTPLSPDATTTLFGVHMDLTWNANGEQRLRAVAAARDVLHARVSRNSLLWHQIESSEGAPDWSRTDAVVDELESAGIAPLFVLYGSPTWANGSADWAWIPQDPQAFEDWLGHFRAFVRAAARRYAGRVRLWEIGNEQNEPNFWKPGPDVAAYARVYRAAREEILAADPAARVATGGLAGVSATGPDGMTGVEFLSRLIDLGVRPDAVALHPYSGQGQGPDVHLPWENNFDDIARVRGVLTARGLSTPLWATEWGWASSDLGEETQAAHVRRSLELIRDRYPYVEVATYFIDWDRPDYPMGLLDADLRPKAAGTAFAAFMTAG